MIKDQPIPRRRYADGQSLCVPSESDLRRIEKAGTKTRLKSISPRPPPKSRERPVVYFESLAKALNPNDPQLTIEGYHANKRINHREKRGNPLWRLYLIN